MKRGSVRGLVGALTLILAMNVMTAGPAAAAVSCHISGTDVDVYPDGDDIVISFQGRTIFIDGDDSLCSGSDNGSIDDVYIYGVNDDPEEVTLDWSRGWQATVYFAGGTGMVNDALIVDGTGTKDTIDADTLFSFNDVEYLYIYAYGGNDTVIGSSDVSSNLYGGIGKDRLVSQASNDVLVGDDGSDRLLAENGDAIIYGGEGRDYIAALDGFFDYVDGEGGKDTCRFDGGDTMFNCEKTSS